jgi:hypothetical protein
VGTAAGHVSTVSFRPEEPPPPWRVLLLLTPPPLVHYTGQCSRPYPSSSIRLYPAFAGNGPPFVSTGRTLEHPALERLSGDLRAAPSAQGHDLADERDENGRRARLMGRKPRKNRVKASAQTSQGVSAKQ